MREIVLGLVLAGGLVAQDVDWAGTWYSSRGTIAFAQKGSAVTGRYGDKGEFRILGQADGAVLTAKFAEGAIAGDVRFLRVAGRRLLRGRLTVGAYEEGWFAWQADPLAKKGKAAKVGGVWRSSLGVLELVQRGSRVTGYVGIGDDKKVRGQVKGRRLELAFDSVLGKGTLWCEGPVSGDGWYGVMKIAGVERAFVARRASGHNAKVFPKPGKTVGGVAANRLFYYLHAPSSYRRGRPVPAIVFLHGKGTNSRSYIEQLAKVPGIGDRYLLIGIDGELWSDKSEVGEPRNEFSFVEWMGKSALPTAARHQRQSPALVAELIADLQKQLKTGKVFVGGHSQGGIMSYYLLMHFPELVKGVFSTASAVTTQCQPLSFTDDVLRRLQRKVPVAIVHGRKDNAMLFQSCEESYNHFADAGFPMLCLFANDGDHGFSSLMFQEAIAWLESMSSSKAQELLAFANELQEADDFGALLAVTQRLKTLRLSGKQKAGVDALVRVVEDAARLEAEELLSAMRQNRNGDWADDFLRYRAQFEFTSAAEPLLAAYQKLRQKHEGPAMRLIAEAFACQQRGDQKGRWAKYQQIIDKYYASSRYAIVKIWQAHR